MEPSNLPEKKTFIEREWNEDIEGKYDEDGFFITPNGSFWDQDYVYFNREGFDRHGGKYDENGEYIPGEGWDDNLNCYESEKEKDENNEENELDEGYTEDAMMKELAQFNDDDDLFEGKDLIKEDPNIEKVIKHQGEKDDFMEDNIDFKEENKNNVDDLEEREDDEYEEIEDEEDKKEENKNNNKNEGKNIINIEKDKKVFVVKQKDGSTFTINGNDDNKEENKIKSFNNDEKYDKNGIEYEINYSHANSYNYNKNNYNKKYKEKYFYNDKHKNYKNNKNNFHKKVYKDYNIFDDNEKK